MVALETAIVIVPFLLLTLMTVEVVLIEFYQSIFAKCVQDVARQIRTGTVTTTNQTTAGLINAICQDTGVYTTIPLPNCVTNTAVILNVVSTTPTFSNGISGNALVTSKLEANGTTSTTFPTSCNFVVFQAFYRWPILIPGNRIFLNSGFSPPGYLFSDAAVFKDEVPATGSYCSGLYN